MNDYTLSCLINALKLGIHMSVFVIAVSVIINVISGRDTFYGFGKFDEILLYIYTVSVWFDIFVGKKRQ